MKTRWLVLVLVLESACELGTIYDCVSPSSICPCSGASLIVEGKVVAIEGAKTTIQLGAVHRRAPTGEASAADESWIHETIVTPRTPRDLIGGAVYVYSLTSRAPAGLDGSMSCSISVTPFELDRSTYLDLALSDQETCDARVHELGFTDPKCGP